VLNVQDASLRWGVRGIEITDFRTLFGVARKGCVASQEGVTTSPGHEEGPSTSKREARDMLDAVFASQRLGLPFEGVLLFGY
jgi:hypothetical protein